MDRRAGNHSAGSHDWRRCGCDEGCRIAADCRFAVQVSGRAGDGSGGGVARVIERWCRWNVDWEVGGWLGQQADDNKGGGQSG